MSWQNESEREVFWREKAGPALILCLIILLFLFFGLRLWYLQVYKGDYFARKSEDNKQRRLSLYAPRGRLLDREGRLLAINEPSYSLALVREDCNNIEKTLQAVSARTNVPLNQIRKNFEQGKEKVKAFNNQIIIPDLTFTQLAHIQGHAQHLPGVHIVVRPRRHYIAPFALSHVLGYVAQANENELRADDKLGLGDNVGKQGLESVLENRLRGDKGLKQTEVDAVGRIIREEELLTPRPGEDVRLTLDLDLQEKVYKIMEDKTGGAVVMNPDNGQLLALVSTPGFDSNMFAQGLSRKRWKALVSDPQHPLQNRCIQSAYPPGSVFKLIVSACGLMQDKIDPEKKVYCSGKHRLGRRIFHCWRRRGHGRVDFERSLIESCDIYYYQLGEEIGVDGLAKFARECGFGSRTGINLPHESSGLIPDREWKKKKFGRSWQKGETLNISIGQGSVLATPLQVARYVSALLNGGWLYRPALMLSETKLDPEKIPVDAKVRSLITQTMVKTVEEPHGTAWRLRTREATIGGKTGTAQVVKLMEAHEDLEVEEIPYRFRDHAWMASFGIKGAERYVVVVMLEHGGHGGSAAGPIVKKLYDYLFAEK
ncbi:MAG: penicillin-binding protein 2 [Thermodesulfobacteriota bacterium]